jgi:hypothetical protein
MNSIRTKQEEVDRNFAFIAVLRLLSSLSLLKGVITPAARFMWGDQRLTVIGFRLLDNVEQRRSRLQTPSA